MTTQRFKTSRQARRARFLPVMRALVRTYQAFEAYDAAHLRKLGLTTSQADVIFTLGNTEGMSFKELGERTLITKGTLTGVVDRLAAKGLVRREPYAHDRRVTIAVLTAKGARLFERTYPLHIAHLEERFELLADRDLVRLQRALERLGEVF